MFYLLRPEETLKMVSIGWQEFMNFSCWWPKYYTLTHFHRAVGDNRCDQLLLRTCWMNHFLMYHSFPLSLLIIMSEDYRQRRSAINRTDESLDGVNINPGLVQTHSPQKFWICSAPMISWNHYSPFRLSFETSLFSDVFRIDDCKIYDVGRMRYGIPVYKKENITLLFIISLVENNVIWLASAHDIPSFHWLTILPYEHIRMR